MKKYEFSLTSDEQWEKLSEQEQKRLYQLEELDHRFYVICNELMNIRNDVIETNIYNEALTTRFSQDFVIQHCHLLKDILREHLRQSLLYSAAEMRSKKRNVKLQEPENISEILGILKENYHKFVDTNF